MKHFENKVVICKEDYELIKRYVRPAEKTSDEMSLATELARAKIVKAEDLPGGTVRIGSAVKIQDQDTGAENNIVIVLPAQADIKNQKISVLTPIGSALIGFRTGDEVEWKLPAGLRKFKILEVN